MKNLNYKGRRVLLTGHTGFKGGWLAIWLDMLGAQVSGIGLDPRERNGVFAESGIARRLADYRQDIMDAEAVQRIFEAEQPEIVFHLAAQPLVLESYRNPVETFAVNTMGTVHVLEAIRHTPSVKAAVVVTSDKCYENLEWDYAYRENDTLGGYDPYSASKSAAEIICSSYRRSFFSKGSSVGMATVRAGNVIGGGDWAENRLIPDLIRSLDQGKALQIRNPQAVRPWQHVLDPLYGYLLLGAKLLENRESYAQAWNFGPLSANIIPVRQLVDTFLQKIGRGSWEDVSDPDQPHEASLLMLDINKAHKYLGWTPTLNLDQTLALTADWYANWRTQSVLDLCHKQIRFFDSAFDRARSGSLVQFAG